MKHRPTTSTIVFVAALASPAIAAAGPPAAVSQPQALFDQGVAGMEAGRFEKACPAIEASQRMEPMPGTLFTLAECEAQRGRLATAIRYYGEYLALYRAFTVKKKLEQKDRASTSEAQLEKLNLLVPRLTLVLPAGSGADVVVKRDGEVVADLSLGTALRVNPGDHVITTQVPGGPLTEHRVSLSPGESRTLKLTVRRDVQPSRSGGAPSGPEAARSAAAGVVPPPAPPDIRPWRIGTWSAGAVAAAGLAVGTVTGILAIQQRNLAGKSCEPDGGCNGDGLQALERLRAFGTASTVGFVTAGVGVAVGVTLILATPSTTPPPQGVTTNPQGVGNSQASTAPWSPVGLQVTGVF